MKIKSKTDRTLPWLFLFLIAPITFIELFQAFIAYTKRLFLASYFNPDVYFFFINIWVLKAFQPRWQTSYKWKIPLIVHSHIIKEITTWKKWINRIWSGRARSYNNTRRTRAGEAGLCFILPLGGRYQLMSDIQIASTNKIFYVITYRIAILD
jgi:hypothetical protein